MEKTSENCSWKGLAARERWSEAQGRWMLGELRRSGLSSKQFAEKHGLQSNRVWHWQKRLDGKPVASTAAKMVEVNLPSRGAQAVLSTSAQIEIDLLNGRRLTVNENTAPETLRALVLLLERS
jgi:hypothetical protein